MPKSPKTQDMVGQFFQTLINIHKCERCETFVPDGMGWYPNTAPKNGRLGRVCAACFLELTSGAVTKKSKDEPS